MEINVGDYVRTNLGIGTVHRFYNDNGDCYVRFSKNVIKKWVTVIKHSKDIIDIIEVGDYVNGVEVENIDDEWITMSDTKVTILKSIANGLIKSIVTKQQFEANAYAIEKER